MSTRNLAILTEGTLSVSVAALANAAPVQPAIITTQPGASLLAATTATAFGVPPRVVWLTGTDDVGNLVMKQTRRMVPDTDHLQLKWLDQTKIVITGTGPTAIASSTQVMHPIPDSHIQKVSRLAPTVLLPEWDAAHYSLLTRLFENGDPHTRYILSASDSQIHDPRSGRVFRRANPLVLRSQQLAALVGRRKNMVDAICDVVDYYDVQNVVVFTDDMAVVARVDDQWHEIAGYRAEPLAPLTSAYEVFTATLAGAISQDYLVPSALKLAAANAAFYRETARPADFGELVQFAATREQVSWPLRKQQRRHARRRFWSGVRKTALAAAVSAIVTVSISLLVTA